MNAPQNTVERALARLRLTTSEALDRRILAEASLALQNATARPARGVWHGVWGCRLGQFAAAVGMCAAVLVLVALLWEQEDTSKSRTVREPTSPDTPAVDPETRRLLAAEQQEIEAQYAARDVEGLILMLRDGRFENNKVLAAQYLGEIGGERALGPLSQLAGEWRGDPAENPFTRALERINSAAVRREPNVPPDREPPQDADPDRDSPRSETGQVVPEPGPAYVLAGRITDAETGEPVAGVTVWLVSEAGRTYTVTTDSNGVYGFEHIDKDGPHSILLNAPEHITPAEWERWERPPETLQLQADGQVLRDYTLERGGKFLITALDGNGRSVKGVDVYAAYVSDEIGRGPRHPSRSDANGVAVVGGLRPDTYLVVAAHPDFALAGEKISLDEPREVKSLVFHLKPGVDVAGVATCSDGLPAGGWKIEAKPLWWKSGVSWPRSDPVAEDGTFLLQHILPGPHRLEVLIPEKGGERGIWSTDVNLPPESGWIDLKIAMPSPHGRVSIAGTVKFTGGGSYEQGFWIHATSAARHFGSAYVNRSRQDFVIPDLVPGLYDLQIMVAGRENEFRNVKAPSEGLILEIAVPRILSVGGRVVDARTRRPVTSFELRGAEAGEQEYRRISSPNGVFEVRTYGPECRVVVRADGYGDKISDNLCRDGNEPVVIELGPPAAAGGVVVDETGRPVEGATVHFRYSRNAEYITSTDREGRFTVDNLSPDDDRRWFVLRHPDYARALKHIEFGRGGAAEVKVVLSRGGTVEGRLYDGQGKPLVNTVLYFMDESHFGYWKENRARLGSVTTDDQGFYRIEHLPEELCYVFREDPDSQLGVAQAAVMPARGCTRRFDIGGTWKVAGRLLREGQPMANTTLLATYDTVFAQGFKASTVTDSDGRFVFYGLPTGQRSIYWVVPEMPGGNRWMMLGTFEFREGVDLDLGDFEAALAEVSVELLAGGPGVPADGWSAVIKKYHDQRFWSRRIGQLQPRGDHADPFVFANVPPGKYEVLAQRDGYPTIRELFELGPGENSRRIVVTMPPGSGAISGKIVSTNKQPSPLMLQSVDQRLTAEIRSDVDGVFVVKNLPAGRYIIGHAMVAANRTSTLAEVSLDEGEQKDVTVDADAGDAAQTAGYLVVLIVTEEGLPLATPHVRLERAGQVILPHFDTDGGKSFAGEPGAYTLHAEYPGYRAVRTTVEMKSRQDRTTQEILDPLVITMMRR